MAAGKKKGGRTILILVLLIAIGALVVFLLLNGAGNKTNSPAPTATPNYELVDIVVASQAISRGNLISADVLTTIKYPKSELPEGTFFSSIDEAVGTKAKYNIDPAVPLTTNMIIKENEGSLASFDIPSGMTAFSIPISAETAVSYAPQKGDHVMVIGCMLLLDVDTQFQSRLPNNTAVSVAPHASESGTTTSLTLQPWTEGSISSRGRYEVDSTSNEPIYVVPSEAQRPRLVCQTIIQNAQVLQVGNFPLSSSGETSATPTTVIATANAPVASVNPSSLTLVVSPQDTVILNYLLLSGTQLSIALRGAGDMGTITTDPVTLQYVMDSKNIPSPLKLPYAIEPRVDTLNYPTFEDTTATAQP